MSSKTYPTLSLESQLFAAGARFVVGIDEVGRGCLAGPVAVGVAVLSAVRHGEPSAAGAWPEQLADSKLISEKVREAIFEPVGSWVSGYAVGMASNAEIDELGIIKCLSLAAGRAIRNLPSELRAEVAEALAAGPSGAHAILDGSHNWLGDAIGPMAVTVRTKADRDCVSVAAASVLAKVTRDRVVAEIAAADAALEPYGFAGNKGYSSAGHLAALRELGPTQWHRRTWLSKILAEDALF